MQVGTYLNAQRFTGADWPGMSVSVDQGCNSVAGWFQVEELTRDASDHLTSFAATFEQKRL